MDTDYLLKSFFSDGTADYLIPPEPKPHSRVTIRFRMAKDAARSVWLCHSAYEDRMQKAESRGQFDYYEIEIALQNNDFHYHFKIQCEEGTWRYGKEGAVTEDGMLLDFTIRPGFSTPAWAKGAVMYQIFVDRFCNGDPSNDVVNGEYFYIDRNVRRIDNWYKAPESFDVADFYGGDLAGVMKKLDYLKDLGIEAIYFNPLFVSPSSHKYDIQDYDNIDPHFGIIMDDRVGESDYYPERKSDGARYRKRVTSKYNLDASNAMFAALVAQAHARGIRVIIDGVFNHCGSFNKWLDREGIYRDAEGFREGAYHSADSPYHRYFRFSRPDAFPENDSYEGWWDFETLPKLNYESSAELEAYILRIAKKWVSAPYHADGWRLDVAADLGHSAEYNHSFWKKFRQAVKEANPNAVIIAEHYGDPSPWLAGDEWDTVMNYDAFMDPVSWFLTGMEKHSEDYRGDLLGNARYFRDTITKNMARFLTPSLQCAMNQLSNHDHSRFLTRTNHKVGRARDLGKEAASEGINKGVFKNAVVLLMTFPGAPTLYYGDEVGLCGFTDPDNRRCYPWGKEDQELLEFHKKIIRIHKTHAALRTGSALDLRGSRNIISFARFNRKEQIIVVVNNDAYSRSITTEVWQTGVPKNTVLKQLLYSQSESTSLSPVEYAVNDGVFTITLPKYSSVILVCEKPES